MVQKKKRRRAVKKTQPPVPTLAEQLDAAREKLFLAIGVVSCARYASDSKIIDGNPDLVDGLKAALELLEDVSEALELLIADEQV